MARNRRNQSAAIRFGPALKAALLCLFIGGSAIGYVWQKDQIDDLGRQIKQRETRFRELRDENSKLTKQLATLRTPRFLEIRARELNLGLVPPQPGQIMRLIELPQEPEPAGRAALFADRHPSTETMR